MNIQDYLPSSLIYSSIKYKYVKDESYIEDKWDIRLRLQIYFKYDKNEDLEKVKILYESKKSPKLNITLYEKNIPYTKEEIVNTCIKTFNKEIGNINNFVDIYMKRNLILNELL